MNNLIVNLSKQTITQPLAQNSQGTYWVRSQAVKTDKFEKQNASDDNKFTFKEAFKNFANGIISPIKAIIKKPLLSIGILASTLIAAQFIPVLVPVMAVGFGILSVAELSKGIYTAVKEYKNGKYDNSEKAFEKIGSGLIGTVLTALGIKQTAKIAVEAKTMSKLNVSDLNILQKDEIAQAISKGSWFNALKENISVLTTKNGLSSIVHQLKPSFLKSRLANLMLGFKQRLTPEQQIEKFKKSPEGIRRANLTDEQLQKEVQIAYDKVFDELKIPKELRPKLIIEDIGSACGEYGAKEHFLKVNPNNYRNGEFDLEHVLMHEATHCKNSLICAKLSKEQLENIICQEIINKVQNGESSFVVYGISPNRKPLIMQPPKFSPQMRHSFAQFAQNNLFKNNSELAQTAKQVDEFINQFITQFPDFVKMNGGNDAKAVEKLMNYITSVPIRKELAISQISSGVDAGKLSLFNFPTQDVVSTVVNRMGNIERNWISQSYGNIPKNPLMNALTNSQYLSSPEEVLCEKAGSEFMIKTVLDKMKALKTGGELTLKKELELLQTLRKEQLNIDYKTLALQINPVLKAYFSGDTSAVMKLYNIFNKLLTFNLNKSFYTVMTKNLKNLSVTSTNNSGVILSQTNS